MEETGGSQPQANSAPATLDVALRGSLPCLSCGYELQGLSVRGACPECGVAIRATILSRVDPEAEAFHPLPTPRLTAFGVFLWPLGALGAALFGWAPRVDDFIARATNAHSIAGASWVGWASLCGLALSALGAGGLLRPTRDTTGRWVFASLIGLLFYGPLAWCWWRIALLIDRANLAPYLQASPNPDRLASRLCLGASALVILLILRHNARQLVSRSLVLRTGRVGRQTVLATAAAVALTMVGDAIRLIATTLPDANRPLVAGAGALLVLVGSLLVTLALVGATVDGWRIRRAILTPSPKLSELIEFRRATP